MRDGEGREWICDGVRGWEWGKCHCGLGIIGFLALVGWLD